MRDTWPLEMHSQPSERLEDNRALSEWEIASYDYRI